MAVGPDLAGQKVRCPHCQQVLVAPAVEPSAEAGGAFQFGDAPATEEPPALSFAPTEAPLSFDSREPPPRDEPIEDKPNPFAKRPSAGGAPTWALAILGPYAVFMTVMATYFYFKYQSARSEYPLELIPDLLGEYKQKETKGAPQTRNIPLPPADQTLPAKLTTTLGKPIRVGAIEVTPLSIEYRSWTAFTKGKNRPEPRKVNIKDTLVLHVRLKNVSPDLTFYPTDPYFDRNPKTANDKPYTLVDVGGKKYFGGIIEYVTELNNTERTWLQGQEADDKPLAPGESRDTVFVTRPRDGIFDAVKKSNGPAVWRVQVRRGLVPFEGTEVPVSAVVGVSFTAADVKKSG
jgi:hypothetical protein